MRSWYVHTGSSVQRILQFFGVPRDATHSRVAALGTQTRSVGGIVLRESLNKTGSDTVSHCVKEVTNKIGIY